ncbi:hypothetical protein ACFE04_009004 [Oxalis oulophora]
MGCINSKRAVAIVVATPIHDPHHPPPQPEILAEAADYVLTTNSSKSRSGRLDFVTYNNEEKWEEGRQRSREMKKLRKGSSNGKSRRSLSGKLGLSNRLIDAEPVVAGWPPWLSSAAAEAVHGWLPLRAEAYEKLDKIGQGTYSYVYRAREVETGRMKALKKVRFDNFQPESIRFMAREIMILRRLDHPNIMKLEGVITSKSSSSIYLVFQYMEHDLAGLSSSPDIKFTESQLLRGLEHCHLRGIMHRDIKTSNILVNDQGILKLADFGLANVLNQRNKNHLTSHVVTLWYRPPELLMGSTSYGVSVDLWSVGCVFAELLLRKPFLKGRTEVEQLHKIFKLCGSPPEEYWKKYKPPYAAMFKPQHTYESSLRERCKDFPTSAVNLLETLLSVDPDKRGTASSALLSEYFFMKPYACDPSSLPKYLPNKEMDAKHREDLRRKKAAITKARDSGAAKKPKRARKPPQEPNSLSKLVRKEGSRDDIGTNKNESHGRGKESRNLSFDTTSEVSQVTSLSQGDSVFSGPANVTASTNFAWVKKRKDDNTSTLSLHNRSRSQISGLESSSLVFANNIFHLNNEATDKNQQSQIDNRSGLEATAPNIYHSLELAADQDKDEATSTMGDLGYDLREKIEFSGPLVLQSNRMDEHLQKNESHIRRAARRTRFEGGTEHHNAKLNPFLYL